jgi:SOS response regulatory protein OraA/RecX
MSFCSIVFEGDNILIQLLDKPERVFKKHVLKPFYTDLKQLGLFPDYLERFTQLEKKAIKHYFLFLLSRKDQLSKELLFKGQRVGFNKGLIEEAILDFKDKGYINDLVLKEKKALSKIKKGYALSQVKNDLKHRYEEAKEQEEETLKKLILKKKPLLISKEIKQRQKGYRFFLYRGYSIDQVNKHLNSVEDL